MDPFPSLLSGSRDENPWVTPSVLPAEITSNDLRSSGTHRAVADLVSAPPRPGRANSGPRRRSRALRGFLQLKNLDLFPRSLGNATGATRFLCPGTRFYPVLRPRSGTVRSGTRAETRWSSSDPRGLRLRCRRLGLPWGARTTGVTDFSQRPGTSDPEPPRQPRLRPFASETGKARGSLARGALPAARPRVPARGRSALPRAPARTRGRGRWGAPAASPHRTPPRPAGDARLSLPGVAGGRSSSSSSSAGSARSPQPGGGRRAMSGPRAAPPPRRPRGQMPDRPRGGGGRRSGSGRPASRIRFRFCFSPRRAGER